MTWRGGVPVALSSGVEIDAHDLVCRFNFFVTKKFEPWVGTRTDIWFLGQLKMPGPKGFRGTKAVGRAPHKLLAASSKRMLFPRFLN